MGKQASFTSLNYLFEDRINFAKNHGVAS